MERALVVSYGFAWLLVTAQALTLGAVLWGFGRIHLRRAPGAQTLITPEGPDLHEPMPGFEGRGLDGRPVRLADHRGRELALLFLSPECAPCELLAREVNRTLRGMFSPPELLIVMEASRSEAASFSRRYGLQAVMIVDEAASIRQDLGVGRTPYGFLIDMAGVVRMKGVVNDREQLEGLIQRRGRPIGGMEWQTIDGPGPRAEPAAPGADPA